MCKNEIVYDTESNTLLNAQLAPGQLKLEPSKEMFRIWSRSRYSSPTNVRARLLQGALFGQGNRGEIDRVTKSFSLSDCYWIKDKDSTHRFEEFSPYFSPFWSGSGEYQEQSIPTLYVDGMLPKYWENREWLIKESTSLEFDCYNLCKILRIPVAEVVRRSETLIAVRNFTDENIMFEASDTSGRLDVADFTLNDVIDVFADSGATMIALDAIIGNIDRHTGNFGFLRDSNTGMYLGMAPLFDFDHALGDVNNILITRAVDVLKRRSYHHLGLDMVRNIQTADTLDVFKNRAEMFSDLLS